MSLNNGQLSGIQLMLTCMLMQVSVFSGALTPLFHAIVSHLSLLLFISSRKSICMRLLLLRDTYIWLTHSGNTHVSALVRVLAVRMRADSHRE